MAARSIMAQSPMVGVPPNSITCISSVRHQSKGHDNDTNLLVTILDTQKTTETDTKN